MSSRAGIVYRGAGWLLNSDTWTFICTSFNVLLSSFLEGKIDIRTRGVDIRTRGGRHKD